MSAIIHNGVKIIETPSNSLLELGVDFVVFPKKTTAQILLSSPERGNIIFNNDTKELWFADGTEWKALVRYNTYQKETNTSFQTVNNTYLTVHSEPINNNDVLKLQIELIGKVQESNKIWISNILVGAVKNNGVITITSKNTNTVETFSSNPSINFFNNGNLSVDFKVHSGSLQIINWVAKIIASKISLP